MIKKLITTSTIASLIFGGAGIAFGQLLDYSLSLSPTRVTLDAGGTAQQVTVTLQGAGGLDEDVHLTIPDLPAYLRASFTPNPVTVLADGTPVSSTLTIGAAAGAPAGTITVTVTGQSAITGTVRTAPLTVTVRASLTVESSSMQLNVTPATGNDKVAYTVTASAPSASISRADLRKGMFLVFDTPAGTFYQLSVPEGGLDCIQNESGGQDCIINQFGRDASGLSGGSLKLSTIFGTEKDTVTMILNDPGILLPNIDYSTVSARFEIVGFVALEIVGMTPNENKTVWKSN